MICNYYSLWPDLSSPKLCNFDFLVLCSQLYRRSCLQFLILLKVKRIIHGYGVLQISQLKDFIEYNLTVFLSFSFVLSFVFIQLFKHWKCTHEIEPVHLQMFIIGLVCSSFLFERQILHIKSGWSSKFFLKLKNVYL